MPLRGNPKLSGKNLSPALHFHPPTGQTVWEPLGERSLPWFTTAFGGYPALALAVALVACALAVPTTLHAQTTEPPAPVPAAATPAPTASATPAGKTPYSLGNNNALPGRGQQGPVDISANGNTNFSQTPNGRIATATRGVTIQTDDATIYCDEAEYNVDTHEAELTGNVRIFRLDTTIMANHAIYNFDTKSVRALDFNGSRPPFAFGGVGLFSPGSGAQYNIRQGTFTTDDSSEPSYHLNARRIRLYPDNRIIYVGATLFIGQTPVFYFPYFYQSLDQQSGYTLTPGYTSTFGAYLLTGVTFPITEHITGVARLDYRSKRGAGIGLNLEYKPNHRRKTSPDGSNLRPYASDDDDAEAAAVTSPQTSPNNATGTRTAVPASERESGVALTGEALSRRIRDHESLQLLTYFVHDDQPDENRTTLARLPVDADRYRIKLSGTDFITDDLFFKADIDKLSDRYLLQDFYEGEFTRNPNPENQIFLVYYQPTFITTLTARAQLNQFFDNTGRLPELALDVPRLPLWNSGFFYESENTAGYLRRTFDNSSPLPEYSAVRLDTFHQFTFPKTYFDWLSVVPRFGVRATYYSHSAPASDAAYDLQTTGDDTTDRQLFDAADPTNLDYIGLRNAIKAFKPQGDIIRPVVDAGVEASFKVSKVYDDAQNRIFGLDQIQHVIQPYINFLEVEDFGVTSRRLLQFDRRLPSTQLQPIDFPQQTAIDSIDDETVVRLGVRNRLQTKRDALTFDWLEVDTFFQIGNDPNQRSNISNVFNQLTFRPVPWITGSVDSQLPLFNGRSGFTEIDSRLQFQATRNLDITISHRYLDHNPFFINSSLLKFNLYYRIDDNWAASFSERYEFADRTLQAQSYTVYRDLTSFVGSLGLTVRDNNGVSDVGVVLNFTLKGVPKVTLPVGFDVNSVENDLTQ